MAKSPRKPKKSADVQKFGGVDNLGEVQFDGHKHEAASIEVKSDRKLTDDPHEGPVVGIRKFTFGANPQAFKEKMPTKQELFNSHLKYIEVALWRDGMQFNTNVEPQIHFDEKSLRYHIIVGWKPARGVVAGIPDPMRLSEIAHGI